MIVHPTAIVENGAEFGKDVRIGPYCVVGREVWLDDEVELISHVVVAGRTKIGPRTRIWPFASVGHQPQDLKYQGEASRLEIGAGCMVREHATLSPGTAGGGMLTSVGDNCLLMMGTHIGHDCRIGSNVIMANNATLGGHVEIQDFAVLGGLSAVHQFVRVGAYAMVGGVTGVECDVIPFGSVLGDRASLGGLNLVGLKRHGFNRETIRALRNAYRDLFGGEGTLLECARAVGDAYPEVGPVQQIVAFIEGGGSRSFCTPRK